MQTERTVTLRDDERAALSYIDSCSGDVVRSVDIGRVVGWAPRTGGPKMASLEKRGCVARRVIRQATFRSDALYGWVLTDLGRAQIGSLRRLSSRWTIHVCPGCNGLVGETTQTHLGDCEYRNTSFVPRSVAVGPVRWPDT